MELQYAEQAAVSSAWFRRAPLKRPATLVDWELAEPGWKTVVEQRLSKIQAYQPGWDGYASKPPGASVIGFARSILQAVMPADAPAPSIVPFSGGGIQLEWHANGFDIELAIYAPFKAELSVEANDGRPPLEDKPLSANYSLLGQAIAELI